MKHTAPSFPFGAHVSVEPRSVVEHGQSKNILPDRHFCNRLGC